MPTQRNFPVGCLMSLFWLRILGLMMKSFFGMFMNQRLIWLLCLMMIFRFLVLMLLGLFWLRNTFRRFFYFEYLFGMGIFGLLFMVIFFVSLCRNQFY